MAACLFLTVLGSGCTDDDEPGAVLDADEVTDAFESDPAGRTSLR